MALLTTCRMLLSRRGPTFLPFLRGSSANSNRAESNEGPEVKEEKEQVRIPPEATRTGGARKSSADALMRIRRRELRFAFPEFLPDPNPKFRNHMVERLQRRDMLSRREMVELPEFYVGSVIAVTISDPNSTNPNKLSRFLGICIARGGTGLRAWCVVRNVVDSQGIEFMYELYSPVVQKVEVIRLRKHVDEDMYYLRDAVYEYQTYPQDMEPEILPEGVPVPIEETVVPLKPRPWTRNWERFQDRLKGYSYDEAYLHHKHMLERREKMSMYLNNGWHRAVERYDLLLHYNEAIPVEEQDAIWAEVGDALEARDRAMRRVAAKRAFSKPQKKS